VAVLVKNNLIPSRNRRRLKSKKEGNERLQLWRMCILVTKPLPVEFPSFLSRNVNTV